MWIVYKDTDGRFQAVEVPNCSYIMYTSSEAPQSAEEAIAEMQANLTREKKLRDQAAERAERQAREAEAHARQKFMYPQP